MLGVAVCDSVTELNLVHGEDVRRTEAELLLHRAQSDSESRTSALVIVLLQLLNHAV